MPSMLVSVALVVCQLSVVDCPLSMVVGLAVRRPSALLAAVAVVVAAVASFYGRRQGT